MQEGKISNIMIKDSGTEIFIEVYTRKVSSWEIEKIRNNCTSMRSLKFGILRNLKVQLLKKVLSFRKLVRHVLALIMEDMISSGNGEYPNVLSPLVVFGPMEHM